MNAPAQGWIRVWIPPLLESFGAWTVEVGTTVGGPNLALPAPAFAQNVRLTGRGVFAAAPFMLALELPVYVEPGRTIEIHLLPPAAHQAIFNAAMATVAPCG